MRDLATNTGLALFTNDTTLLDNTVTSNTVYLDSNSGHCGLGTTPPTSKLHVTDNKIYKTMNNQAKVIVIKVTKFKKSGLIKTSEVINEGWLAKKPNISLELQAIKAFKIPVDDLDNIIIKEVLTIAF